MSKTQGLQRFGLSVMLATIFGVLLKNSDMSDMAHMFVMGVYLIGSMLYHADLFEDK